MKFPGAGIVRRLKKKITVDDICLCGFCELKIDPKLTSLFETITFNHQIADFSKQQFNVFRKGNTWGDEVFWNLQTRVSRDLRKCIGDIKFGSTFSVDISLLGDCGMGFNHASCGCVFPKFELNECTKLSSFEKY